MIRSTAALVAILCAGAMGLPAADKPDFSGEWTLNASKSDFGPMPAPEKMIRKVEHKDPDLKITTTTAAQGNERKNEAAYKTDGSESVNKSGSGESKSVVKWEGANITIATKREIQGMTIEQNEKWTLSEDGKTLTIDGLLKAPQGELNLKMVMEKQ
jgi:hypothetical protein